MLKHTLLATEGILILEPSGPLETADFEAVIDDIEPYLVTHKALVGVMIFAKAFPGWLNLESAISHLQLIERFHQKIKRLAIVSDNGLMEGTHSLARCSEVTEEVLRAVFHQLYIQRVELAGMLLKPNMVLPGLDCPEQQSVDEVADATVNCLMRSVPAAVAGIAFLSGGQSSELASARLNAMNIRFASCAPWPLSFSFARAIQQPAMEIWSGKEANVEAAQVALAHRADCNRAARRGDYSASMESKPMEPVGGQR